MKNPKIWNLMHRYLSGECGPEEKEAFSDWLAEDPTHQEFFNAIRNVWEVSPNNEVDVHFDEEWERLSTRLGLDLEEPSVSRSAYEEPFVNQRHGSRLKQVLRVAAIIIIMALPAYYFLSPGNILPVKPTEAEVAMQKIQTGVGERTSIEFSDGSQVLLNAMSTLRSPKKFNGSKREIYLTGEAFFKVTRNDGLPFIVHTNGVSVEVLGTEFNVSGYEEDKGVEVVVKDGKVAVSPQTSERDGQDNQGVSGNKSRNNSLSKVTLTKGQQTLVKAGEAPSSPKEVSLEPYLDWVNGQMVFNGTSMREVIPRLRRTYDLNFEVSDPAILSKRLKASFERESPEKVLSIISFSLDIGYQMREDTVVFNLNK